MSARQTTSPPPDVHGPIGRWLGMPAASALAVIAIGLSPVLFAAIVQSQNRQLYFRSVQEDGFLEWATFWGLLIAGTIFLRTAARRSRPRRRPWFPLLVGLFCLFVAGEEISWGQRLVGYRPPDYFLAENFQQELNLHNVWDTDLRKLLAKATLLVYGVVLPLTALAAPLRRGLERLGVLAPPLAILPVFLGAFIVYHSYPWRFSGEITEAAMAFGFLFAAMAALWTVGGPPRASAVELRHLGLGLTAVVTLSAITIGLGGVVAADPSPERLEQTRSELAAMGNDLMLDDHPITRCGIHKRVFSWVEKYDGDRLRQGSFSRLVGNGLSAARAEYFLDPWNSPYWVRHRCASERRRQRLFVYSFGPDRRRQSTEWDIRGDDVGIVIFERGF